MENKKVSAITQSIVDKVFEILELDTENFDWAMESIVDHVSAEVSSLMDEMQSKNKDDMFRAAAAMESFKKRKEREYEILKKTANKKVIESILPVIDSIDISLRLNHNKENEVLQKQFLSILKTLEVERVAVDSEFDPNIHEAIKVEVGEPGLSVLLNGYTLNGVLLRPAKVIIHREEI